MSRQAAICLAMYEIAMGEAKHWVRVLDLASAEGEPRFGCASESWRSWWAEEMARRARVAGSTARVYERLEFWLDRAEHWARECARWKDKEADHDDAKGGSIGCGGGEALAGEEDDGDRAPCSGTPHDADHDSLGA